MFANLLKFYDHYPEVMFSLKQASRDTLSPDLLEELDFHGERQRDIFSLAQIYQIDGSAEMMLRNLSAQMQNDGLDSMFSSIRLPFPAMFISLPEPAPETGYELAALITQDDDALYTQVYLANKDGLLPNLLVFRSQGTSVDVVHSPTLKLARASGDEVTDDAAMEQERDLCFDFLSLAVGMSILFEHKAMLETETVPAHPRAERRRAQRLGRALPKKTIIKVSLGDLGKRQVQATQEESMSGKKNNTKRRAHWVQGHFMRNRAGGISWRNPHIRGAGPVIEQERYVSFEGDRER